MARAVRHLARWLASRLERYLDAAAPSRRVDGILIIDRFSENEGGALLFEVEFAIRMLKAVDPGNYARLKRHIRMIAIVPLRATGYFHRQGGRVAVSGAMVSKLNANSVALTLIHEAAHARISALGVKSRTLEERTWEEQACERSVRRFVARMAKRYPEWERYNETLQAEPLPRALSDDGYWSLRRSDLIESLIHSKAPSWLVRVVERRASQPTPKGEV